MADLITPEKYSAFQQELNELLGTLCEKHGLFKGALTIIPSKSFIYIKADILCDNPDLFYGNVMTDFPLSEKYRSLKIGTKLVNPSTSKVTRIIGKHPEFRDDEVLAKDEDGNYYKVSVNDALLMVES